MVVLALADFGLSKLAAARSANSSVRGYTPDHVPPELLKGEECGFPGDVYSLVTTIWQLLMGRPPFRTVDDAALAVVMMRILQDPVPPLDRVDVDPWMRELVQAMTAKDPASRPSAQEIVAQLALHQLSSDVFGQVQPVVAEDVAGFITTPADGAACIDTGTTQLWAWSARAPAPGIAIDERPAFPPLPVWADDVPVGAATVHRPRGAVPAPEPDQEASTPTRPRRTLTLSLAAVVVVLALAGTAVVLNARAAHAAFVRTSVWIQPVAPSHWSTGQLR